MKKIIVALDFANSDQALSLAERLDPKHCRVKVGKELFTRAGPSVVEKLTARGYEIFLDLKFHDIPNTVAAACAAASDLGVWMVNVHALGGRRMIEAAREAIDKAGHKPLLTGVTILTSMGEGDLAEIGLLGTPAENVKRLAALVQASGGDGVVCSPKEVAMLRAELGSEVVLVTPGIRPAWAAAGDQKRIMTPREAVTAGASHLVIGRPITAADDPIAALARIEKELC